MPIFQRQVHALRKMTRLAAAVTLLAVTFGCATVQAQRPPAGPPPDTSYVAGMPSVDKVKQTIQGSDPIDTVARQVAVFNLMPMIIQQMGLAPTRHFGDTTQQEKDYLNQCSAASYQLSQDFSKSHSPADVTRFNGLHNKYETDGPFWQDMLNKLFTTQFLAAYSKVNRDANAAFQAHVAQEQKQGQPSAGSGNSGGLGAFDPLNPIGAPAKNSGPNKAQTRCLELGWSKGYCMGGTLAPVFDFAAALGNVMASFMGPVNNSGPPPAYHGLILGGDFKSSSGVEMAFSSGGGLTLSGCGNLIPRGSGMSVAPRGNGYALQMPETPPVALSYTPGGPIVGPASATIHGQIITGYNIVSQSRRYSDGTIVPGSVSNSKVPVYGAATATCAFGTFQLFPQNYPAQDAQSAKEYGTNDLAGKPIPNGMLMSGIYAAAGAATPGAVGPSGAPAGLRVEFSVNNVIIDCGQAHVKADYSVRNVGGQVSIAVANDKSPFTLTLQSNGSLSGSGTTTVNGRLLTGQDASGNFNFKPVSATCNIGSLPAS